MKLRSGVSQIFNNHVIVLSAFIITSQIRSKSRDSIKLPRRDYIYSANITNIHNILITHLNIILGPMITLIRTVFIISIIIIKLCLFKQAIYISC